MDGEPQRLDAMSTDEALIWIEREFPCWTTWYGADQMCHALPAERLAGPPVTAAVSAGGPCT